MAVNAVKFDGTNDYLTRGAGLTGATDSAVGSLAFFVRFDDEDTDVVLLGTGSPGVRIIRFGSTNHLEIGLVNIYNSSFFRFETVTQCGISDGWISILASWDTNFGPGNKISHLYKNLVSDKFVGADTDSGSRVDYTNYDWIIGAIAPTGGYNFEGGLAHFWFAPGQFIDFSVQANRELFVNPDGTPVENLGWDGSIPTGTVPLVYLNGDASTFHINRGSGGNFSVTGALEDTPPPGVGTVVTPSAVSATTSLGSVTPVITLPNATVQISGLSATAELDDVAPHISAIDGTIIPIGFNIESAVGNVIIKRSALIIPTGLALDTTLSSALYGAFSEEITADDFDIYLSGGASNIDGNLSLGGAKSATKVGELGNLFDDVSAPEISTGDIEYRCIYLANDHISAPLTNVKLWIESQSVSSRTKIQLSLGGTNASEPAIVNEDTAPIGVTFVDAPDHNPLLIPDLAPGEYQAVWIKREVVKLAAGNPKPQDYAVLRVLAA